MAITIIKIAGLLCFLILPLMGPSKRRPKKYKRPDKTFISAHYGINKDGELEELFSK
ncbi:hypothetical protein [Mucilaginibacter corticis]|uniref:hypothetical protein n=1 Tax=Mucilaginibacter corticis TaxID=2597670 RepID=UPI001642E320|nr:hypothetical protein [Mucilaginibacter corticis]